MLDFQEKMDAMIQNGDVPEMIVVMPNASKCLQGQLLHELAYHWRLRDIHHQRSG
jgi:hypothetical protein